MAHVWLVKGGREGEGGGGGGRGGPTVFIELFPRPCAPLLLALRCTEEPPEVNTEVN